MRSRLFAFIGLTLIVFGTALWYVLTPPTIQSSSPTISPTPTLPQTFSLIGKKLYTLPSVADSFLPFPILAQAGIAIEPDTGQVFWAKDINTPHYIASLTKIMTAVVALELASPAKNLTISERAAGVGEATMNLKPGETYTLEELLWGLMLHSGNDAAEAIAENLGGRSLVFTQLMNQKADQLQLSATHFVNPTGLDEDVNTASSFLPGQIYRGQTGLS